MKNSRGSKRERERKHRRRLKRLSAIGFLTGAVLVEDEYCRSRTVTKPFYKKRYKSGNHPTTGCLHSCKKISNRKVRQFKDELPVKGNSYKKLYDLWWQMY